MCAFLYGKGVNSTFLECAEKYNNLKNLGIFPHYFIVTTSKENYKFKTFNELWHTVHTEIFITSILEVRAYRKTKLKRYYKIWD